MRRRELFALLGGVAAAHPLAAHAQRAHLPVIGYLSPSSAATTGHLVDAFRDGLARRGFVEGRNVAVVYRWAEGRSDRLPALIDEFVRLNVSVIVATGGGPVPIAAKAATSTIPIVFYTGEDPVESGLVASLSRPGGNLTGAAGLSVELGAKQLELLREAVPGAEVVGLIENPANLGLRVKAIEAAAKRLGRKIEVVYAGGASDLDAAFEKLVQRGARAFLIIGDSVLMSLRREIVAQAARHALPAIYSRREFPLAGGLMSYGGSLVESYRILGDYAARVLAGARPADLPVQQSKRVELVVNLKTAAALGLEIPPILLARADEVIE